MPGTSKYEITRDIHGAIRLITNADGTALVSPKERAFRADGRVCPLIYVAEAWDVHRLRAGELMFPGELPLRFTAYLTALYDDQKNKPAGKRAVLRFLKLYRDDQLAAQREVIHYYNPIEPFPNP